MRPRPMNPHVNGGLWWDWNARLSVVGTSRPERVVLHGCSLKGESERRVEMVVLVFIFDLGDVDG